LQQSRQKIANDTAKSYRIGFIATKKDLAKDMSEVKQLEDEFGFKHASVIGMFIFSMNAFVSLHFATRKLAKFMVRPGRLHFAATAHLLRHLRCNRRIVVA
jgi:hypothetical protein